MKLDFIKKRSFCFSKRRMGLGCKACVSPAIFLKNNKIKLSSNYFNPLDWAAEGAYCSIDLYSKYNDIIINRLQIKKEEYFNLKAGMTGSPFYGRQYIDYNCEYYKLGILLYEQILRRYIL